MSAEWKLAILFVLVIPIVMLLGFIALRPSVAQTSPGETVRSDPAKPSTSENSAAGNLIACDANKATIEASALPRVAGQFRKRIIENPSRCSTKGKLIMDNGVGNYVPPIGESVYIETYGPGTSQEFGITHRKDGTILLDLVGNESGEILDAPASGTSVEPKSTSKAVARAECQQNKWNNAGFQFDSPRYRWYFNKSTTPSEMLPDRAETAVRRAGTNMADVRNNCGLADKANVSLEYLGVTNTYADIPPDAPFRCGQNDGKREVSFGRLPVDPRIGVPPVAVSCRWSGGEISDIKLNKYNYFWTAKGAKDAQCSDGNPNNNPWDVQAIGTHERGHNFGFAHVSERYYGALTMSTDPNGPCQASERTLGRGDVRGMNTKY